MVNDHDGHWKVLIAEVVVFGVVAVVVVDDHHWFAISPVAMRKVVPAAADDEDDEVGEIAVDETAEVADIVVADIVDDVEDPLRHNPPRRQPFRSHFLPPHWNVVTTAAVAADGDDDFGWDVGGDGSLVVANDPPRSPLPSQPPPPRPPLPAAAW